ncbi:MAG TPA: multifunctional oxoglutarate decarboxylase/oxoglutarate dehydrogenase thiamine pyrophosphate-binding subunit/dihydrolipoyllysine-residue succinyltransferase subunit, partial [Acidimicrobiales bacterium]|nr:multifunctional oxoglutarate decarboxylase/oxoglutarate dehydrogenase thiamine pyrophosphate-binding subunit/dihydrolipoyllysine-residue succinyltransferase subunit [Acidimicrobiales bacterium]
MAEKQTPDLVGPNAWMVDEMYEQYLADPSSVSESWQDFFADYRSDVDAGSVSAPAANGADAPVAATPSTSPAPKADPPKKAEASEGEAGEPIRGVGARIVENLEKSLAVPTATSYRNVPAKLLEVNRAVINGYLG